MFITRSILVPYTAFHIASIIRSLDTKIWNPKEVLLVNGLGTTKTRSGKKYLIVLLNTLTGRNIKTTVIEFNLLFFIRLLIIKPNYELVTGNPRRWPSLLIGRKAASILIIDEGLGTIMKNGYLSKNFKEKSFLKKVLIAIKILPEYRKIFSKIRNHITVYDNSIFPNPVKIKYRSILTFEDLSFKDIPKTLFISSNVKKKEINQYISWAKSNFNITSDTYLSIHPQMPESLSLRLAKQLNIKILDIDILLEEYIFLMANLGYDINIIGQENSSSVLLKQIGIKNISCSNFILK